jgi:NAD(P)-dependent dehydrogenase (short-subunit alcohol dehydrogenase family)
MPAYVQTGILEESSTDEAQQQFQANMFGPLTVYRAVLPYLREKTRTPEVNKGTLVIIGSMAAWFPLTGCNLYNASKAAMRLLSIGLAGEITQFNIRHTLVEPGYYVKAESAFAQYNGAQLGEPVKVVNIIYDVITSTGVAEGKGLPEFSPLGSDASTQIAEGAQKAIVVVDEWRGISALSDFPSGP